jgi:NADH dehydrogenase [ubiquinone] 1 alpha subcomplex assembly factor 1
LKTDSAMRGKATLRVALLLVSTFVMAKTPNLIDLDPGPWQVVNDGVMGGVSSGEIIQIPGGLRFQGFLSLDNNGGFASVRRQLDNKLQDVGSVRLKVRGDGRTYQMRVRQDSRFDGVAWRAEFPTSGKWQTIELSFDDFKPVWRGRSVSRARPVIADKVRQIGFLLADKKQDSFRLDIGAIEFLPEGSIL